MPPPGCQPIHHVAASPFVIAAKDAGLIGYDIHELHHSRFRHSIGNSVSRWLSNPDCPRRAGLRPQISPTSIDRPPLFSTNRHPTLWMLGYVTLSASGPIVFDGYSLSLGLRLCSHGVYLLGTHPLPQSRHIRGTPLDEIPFKPCLVYTFLRRLDSHLPCSCGTGIHIPSLYTSL